MEETLTADNSKLQQKSPPTSNNNNKILGPTRQTPA